jgi:hypothetical protein
MVLCAAPIAFMVEHLYPGKGIGALVCTWVLLVAVLGRWKFRKRIWFWITISLMVALQVPIVGYFPWMERKWLFVFLLPVLSLDFVVVFGCIKLVEKATTKEEGEPSHN